MFPCNHWLAKNKGIINVSVHNFRIGHDNKGGGAAWFLENVIIDCPSLGRTWTFPCSRWLAKNKGDNQLEVELFPQELATAEYAKCMCYFTYLCHYENTPIQYTEIF